MAPHTLELYDLDEKLLATDRTDIDMQVLSAPLGFFDWAEPQVAIKMAYTPNKALGNAVQEACWRVSTTILAGLSAASEEWPKTSRGGAPLSKNHHRMFIRILTHLSASCWGFRAVVYMYRHLARAGTLTEAGNTL
jgi:hypothetical protein